MSELFADPSTERESLEGTIAREVFRSPDGGFAVLRVETKDQDVVTVAGPLPPGQEGETLEAEGEWVLDPRHGRQFKVSSARLRPPTTAEAVERFLASGSVNGVGPALASRIVEAFGDETLEILSSQPKRLLEVAGIGKKKLSAITESWEAQRATREVMLYLRGHGLGPALADKVYQRFGADAVRILDEDPYVLSREIEGAGFLTADRLAQALGFEAQDPRRLRAGLLHIAQEALNQGSTAVPVEALLERAAAALGVAAPAELESALHEARTGGHLELDRPADEDVIYLPGLLRAERSAARLTVELARAPVRRLPPYDVEEALGWLAEHEGLALSYGQQEALRAALSANLTIVTGGPGVGKTTVVRSLVQLLRRKAAAFALAAPTGRAAKRMEEATGAPASTLHRLLDWDPRGGGFGKDASDPLDVDLLVVDEASMVDVRLFHAVVRALPPGASLVFIGDVDQLPSVGPGNVLADLLSSGAARVVHLDEVFRQAASSRIITSAHAINAGAVPDLGQPNPGVETDFFFVSRNDPQAAQDVIVRMVKERIPLRYGLDPFKDVQVLAPMHKGICGTDGLNAALKAALNPPDDPALVTPGRGDRLDVGDKVMQLRNDYEHEVFNGDVGRVIHTEGSGIVVVSFEGKEVVYARGERSRLALAYCATIHKSQGSEYPAVVVPLLTEHYVMLERNLLYTAITRARQLVVLVGQRRAVELAVGNDRPRQRLSFLDARIRAAISA